MQSFKSIKRWLSLALCLMLCLPMLPGQAQAIDPIDLEAKTSLSMVFQPEERVAKNVTFQIYRVGEPDRFCNFTKTEAFAAYDVAISNLSVDDWAALAITLDGYVERDKIPATATAVTDGEGVARFADLQTGLYLVTGDAYKSGRTTYTPTPVMISLPSRDAQEQWHYDVSANVKWTKKVSGGGSSTVDVKVVKIWEGDEDKEARPKEVTIQLLKDGKVHDTVTLSQDTNWRHTWTKLSKTAKWTVVEKDVPEEYVVLVSKDSEYSFVVKNTLGGVDVPPGPPPLDPPDDPPPSDPPEENPPEDPPKDPPGDNPPGNTPPGNNPPGNTPPPNLPQTGMLWWPVPLLAVSGMAIFMAGWIKDRKDSDYEA